LDDRLARLRARLAEAEAAEPAVARALALLERGEFAAAITEFEAVLRDLPGHGRAVQGLRDAKAAQEAHWAAQLEADHRLGEAAALLEEGEPACCLEVLDVLAPQTPGPRGRAARKTCAARLRRRSPRRQPRPSGAQRAVAGARAPRLRLRSWRAHGVRPSPQPR
jgi:hypothetical protein